MRGIILRNGGLFVMNGLVASTRDDPSGGFHVVISYQEYDSYEKKMILESTDIIFNNQEGPRPDGKPPVPYAEIARKMHPRNGSAILAVVTFPGDTNDIAYGYCMKRSGIISFRDEDGKIVSSVISGYVIKTSVNEDGSAYFLVTAEPRRNGMPDRYVAVVHNKTLAKNMIRDLSPAGGGFVRVALRCGPQTVIGDAGVKTSIFPCSAYDVMGMSGTRSPSVNAGGQAVYGGN